jgi:hypothetical protein
MPPQIAMEGSGTKPPFFDIREEREGALRRLKDAADSRREKRVKRVLAQEGEGLLVTVGRVFYLSCCVLFDGLILMEIPVRLGRTCWAWLLYLSVLSAVIGIQRHLYGLWFEVDISQIDFEQE